MAFGSVNEEEAMAIEGWKRSYGYEKLEIQLEKKQ